MPQQPPSPIQFLTQEESADINAALLSSEEKFLTRLTISSWRLLQTIAEQLEVPLSELTHKQIIAWFEQDGKIRREQGKDAAVLKW